MSRVDKVRGPLVVAPTQDVAATPAGAKVNQAPGSDSAGERFDSAFASAPGRPGMNAAGLQDLKAHNFLVAVAKTNSTNNPESLNSIDAFRAGLQPAERGAYDAELSRLREDPRIEFQFKSGAQDTPATRDLALRGMVAASFGRPQDLNDAIQSATNTVLKPNPSGGVTGLHAPGQGKFTITFYPGTFDSTDVQPGAPVTLDGGLTTRTGIAASTDFLYSGAQRGDNMFLHEFSHAMQGLSTDGLEASEVGTRKFPPDFTTAQQERFQEELQSSSMQSLLKKNQLYSTFGIESFPTIQNLFRQKPSELERASPALYQEMVQWSGLDAVSGTFTSAGQARVSAAQAGMGPLSGSPRY